MRSKEDNYWDFVPDNHYRSPVLHNQINLKNNALYNLLDYGNDKNEQIN